MIGVEHEQVFMVWVTEAGSEPAEVEVTLADGGGSPRTYTPRREIPPFLADKPDKADPGKEIALDIVRNCALIDGLKPASKYTYKVLGPGRDMIAAGEFRTVPRPGSAEAFTFTVMSDTHKRHGAVAESVGRDDTSFAIIVGDITNRGYIWEEWTEFFSTGRPYQSKIGVLPVIGGHDIENYSRVSYLGEMGGSLPKPQGYEIFPAQNYRSIWCQAEPELKLPNKNASYYSGLAGNLRYIMLDTYIPEQDMEKQLQWLDDTLRSNEALWTIVCYHEPAFAVSSRGRMDKQQRFVEIFERYGVDFALSGHNHMYERFLPFASPGRKLVQYVNLNSNGHIGRIARPSPIHATGTGWRGKCYLEFRVDGNKLTMVAKAATGEEFDRLELSKQNGELPEAYVASAIPRDYAKKIAHLYTAGGKPESHVIRKDIEINLASVPKAGAPVRATLDTSNFPKGSKLHMFTNPDSAGWQISPRVFEIDSEKVEFLVMLPLFAKTDSDGEFNPPIKLLVNFEHQGRLFAPSVITPNLGEKTKRMLLRAKNADK